MTNTKGSTQKTKLLRQCTVCREMKQKKELIRIVRSPEGTVCIDETGRMNGRGAYLCRSRECLTKARRSKVLDRSLKIKVPQEIYDMLEEEMPE